MMKIVCPQCNGARQIRGLPCPTCRGGGAVTMRGMGEPTAPSFQPVLGEVAKRPTTPYVDTPTLIYAQDGTIVQNTEKDFQKSFYLRVLGPGDAFPIAVSANSFAYGTAVVPAEERDKGDFEIVKLMATGTGRFSVEIKLTGVDRSFSNNPIPNQLIFGSAVTPAYLPETIYVPATSNLTFKITDLSGAANNVRIVLWGRRFIGGDLPAQRAAKDKGARWSHPFWLTFNDGSSVALTANQSNADFYMRVPDQAYFECMGAVDDSAGEYNIEVYEGQSSRSLTDGPIPARDFFAAPAVPVAGRPGMFSAAAMTFDWPFSMIFKPATNIRVRLSDTSGAANTIRLALAGRLLYYPRSKA